MLYRQLPPPPADLKPWVECVWLLRGTLAPEGQVILPDGRLELVFHFGDPPLAAQGRQPPALIAGRMVEALELQGTGVMDALGVRLRPEAGGCLVPCHLLAPVESMDGVLGVWARCVREILGNARTEVARVDLIWTLLRSLAGGRRQPDPAVAHSVRVIEATRGRGPVEAFLPPGIGARQWQRRFSRSTGFGPKAFARITRLQHLVGLCELRGERRWTDLALEAGFYDQAHLANEFRTFSGQSPEAYFRARRGMAEFYRDGFFQDEGTAPNVRF